MCRRKENRVNSYQYCQYLMRNLSRTHLMLYDLNGSYIFRSELQIFKAVLQVACGRLVIPARKDCQGGLRAVELSDNVTSPLQSYFLSFSVFPDYAVLFLTQFSNNNEQIFKLRTRMNYVVLISIYSVTNYLNQLYLQLSTQTSQCPEVQCIGPHQQCGLVVCHFLKHPVLSLNEEIKSMIKRKLPFDTCDVVWRLSDVSRAWIRFDSITTLLVYSRRNCLLCSPIGGFEEAIRGFVISCQ